MRFKILKISPLPKIKSIIWPDRQIQSFNILYIFQWGPSLDALNE